MAQNPNPVILPGPEEVAREAADRISGIAQKIFQERGCIRLVLSGGSTPRRLYELLPETPYRDQIPWRAVHFYWADERCVGPDHPDSNFRMAREAFLEKLGIPASQIHRLRGETEDPDTAAREYEATIRRHFNLGRGGSVPHFDLVLLGMGSDGHTASLFPKTEALRETGRWVVANSVPKLKACRLTLTPLLLNQAFCVIFLVTGADKAQTLSEVLEGPFRPEDLPAQLIRPGRGSLFWLVDQAAAGSLRKKDYP